MSEIIPVRDLHYNLAGELTFSIFKGANKKQTNKAVHEAEGLHALWQNLNGPERFMLAKRKFIHHQSESRSETRLFAPFMVQDGKRLYRPVYERLKGRWRLIKLPARFLMEEDSEFLFRCPTLSPLAEALN